MAEQDKQEALNTRLLTLAAPKEIKAAKGLIDEGDLLTQQVLSITSVTSEATREWIERALSKEGLDWRAVDDIGEHIAAKLKDTCVRLNILEETGDLPETWRMETEKTHLVPAEDPLVVSLFESINERTQAALAESKKRGIYGENAKSILVTGKVSSSPKGINLREIDVQNPGERITQRNKKLGPWNLQMHIRNGVAIMGSEEHIYIPEPENPLRPPSPAEVLLQAASKSRKPESAEFYKKLAAEDLSMDYEEAKDILKMDDKKMKSFTEQQTKNIFRYYGYRIRRVNGTIIMERNKLKEVEGKSKQTPKPELPEFQIRRDLTDNRVPKQPDTDECYSESALRALVEITKKIKSEERKLFIVLLSQNPKGLKREDVLEQLGTTKENLQKIIIELNYIVLKKRGIRIKSVENIVFIEISNEELAKEFIKEIDDRKQSRKEKAAREKEARAAIAAEKKAARIQARKAAEEAARKEKAREKAAREKKAEKALSAEMKKIAAREAEHAKIDKLIARLEKKRAVLEKELSRMNISLGGIQGKLTRSISAAERALPDLTNSVPQVSYVKKAPNGKVNVQVEDLFLIRERIEILMGIFRLECELVTPPQNGLYRVNTDKYNVLLQKLSSVEAKISQNDHIEDQEVKALKNRFNRMISNGYSF